MARQQPRSDPRAVRRPAAGPLPPRPGPRRPHLRDAVILAPTVANRDPAAFPDPATFDPSRDAGGHLAFGYGPRYCIGAALARVELQAVFAALPARFPTLGPAVPVERLELRTDLLTGGLKDLPVQW